MKKAPLEKSMINSTLKMLRSRGAFAVKIHGGPFQERGIPDILACYKGRFIGLEGKRYDEELSAYQTYQIERIRQAGGVAYRILSVEDAIDILNEIDEKTRQS